MKSRMIYVPYSEVEMLGQLVAELTRKDIKFEVKAAGSVNWEVEIQGC